MDSKSNEIPAVQELLKINGCVVVDDALNCQKKTAEAIIDNGADYLLCIKDNQENLKKDIEDYVQDKVLQAWIWYHRVKKTGNAQSGGPHMYRMTSTGCQAEKNGKG